tara:strand:- start:253 stop:561 length:309 start_codon:yes stop_codon:yes gene_type:complete
MFVKITDDYEHTGAEVLEDFTGWREVAVRSVDPTMVGAQPNCCIANSRELCEYDNLWSVKGFYTHDGKIGLAHYWNYSPDDGVYYDCTPRDEPMRYFVEEAV